MVTFFFYVEASVRVMSTNQTLISQTSAFGPRIGEYGLLAHVYEPLEDATGCQIVQGPDTRWIALVHRGGCSFQDKVQSMQNSGAIAVIVGDEYSLEWITMSSEDDTSDIKIPSIFLTRTEYSQLLHAQQLQMRNSRRLLVLLEDEDKIPWSSTTLDCTSLIILIICPVLLFILASILLRLRKQYISSLCQYEHQQQHLQKHATLNEIDLEICLPRHCNTISTATTPATTMDDDKDETECPICLDYFDQGSEYRVLPCRHAFHTVCIDPWLTGYKSSCPVCSQDFTTNINRIPLD
ncbi:unnamed protein product [Absidia cylindrospora]